MAEIKFDECNQPYREQNGTRIVGCPNCGATHKETCFCGACNDEECEICGDPVVSYPGPGMCDAYMNQYNQVD
jgi:hypothetical protein